MSLSIPSEAQLAYNTVLKGDPKVEWAIFSLASAGNELKLQATGSGLDDLQEEFMDGRIQYAFARVEDPNSNLEKFVQINWCGEGVPERQKGHFNTYASQISSFLKNSHIIIQARNEADITPQHIHKRMNESSGSKYTSAPSPASAQVNTPAPKPYTAPSSSFTRPAVTGNTPSFQRSTAPPAISRPSAAASAAPPPVSAHIPAPEPAKPSFTPASASVQPAEDRIAPVGTAYQPVSLPKPKKLGNRWGPGAVPIGGGGSDDDERSGASSGGVPKPSAFASARSAFGGGGGAQKSFGGAAATFGASAAAAEGGKKLTWSERQAEAKRQREEEEQAAQEAMTRAAEAAPVRAYGGSSSGAVNSGHTAALSPEEEGASSAPPPAPPAAPLPPRVPAVADDVDEDDEEKKRDNEDDWDDAPPAPPPPAPFRPIAAPAPPAKEEEEEEEASVPAIAQLHKMQANLRLDESGIPASAPAPPVPTATRPVAATRAEEQGPKAKAEYDYQNEVSFAENDILTQIEQTDEAWWTGTNPQGQRGLFPANYVTLLEGDTAASVKPEQEEEEAPPPAPPAPPMPPRDEPAVASKGGKWAVAQYDYNAAEDNEISLREGEHVIEIEETDEAWWTGTAANGQRGLFPAGIFYLTRQAGAVTEQQKAALKEKGIAFENSAQKVAAHRDAFQFGTGTPGEGNTTSLADLPEILAERRQAQNVDTASGAGGGGYGGVPVPKSGETMAGGQGRDVMTTPDMTSSPRKLDEGNRKRSFFRREKKVAAS
ncbi:hypothetical protein QFC21_006971 [Naganishia friedmannii]|uniref:Uncharacterized protein n=1 Tax=Naganishia friedmannii TaxID=89922 RepID=A0ACC2UZ15_9TREE|nr:hypothetical protein QFC21_006971 [Naganishia friedmannii]